VVERSSISAVAEESVPSVGDGRGDWETLGDTATDASCVFEIALGPASGVVAGDAEASVAATGAAAEGGATGGTGTPARGGSEVGRGGFCSGSDDVMGLVSCVRNSDEMGSMRALGGIGWTGGDATGGGADSRTGEVGSIAGAGAAAAGGAGGGVFSGTSCNVALVGRAVVATDVIET
jgi:hypothetical protein